MYFRSKDSSFYLEVRNGNHFRKGGLGVDRDLLGGVPVLVALVNAPTPAQPMHHLVNLGQHRVDVWMLLRCLGVHVVPPLRQRRPDPRHLQAVNFNGEVDHLNHEVAKPSPIEVPWTLNRGPSAFTCSGLPHYY